MGIRFGDPKTRFGSVESQCELCGGWRPVGDLQACKIPDPAGPWGGVWVDDRPKSPGGARIGWPSEGHIVRVPKTVSVLACRGCRLVRSEIDAEEARARDARREARATGLGLGTRRLVRRTR